MTGYKFQYNGYTLQDQSNVSIAQVMGLGLPPVRSSEANKTGADGGNVWVRKYGMRTILIGADVYENDLTTYYNLRNAILQAFCITDNTTLLLTRSDGVVRSINAFVVKGPDYSEEVGHFAEAKFNIELRCDSPFFGDSSESSYSTNLAQYGGTPILSPIPSPIGNAQGGQFTINNVGDVDWYAKFVITGPIVNPTVTNTTTGESFTFNLTLLSGQTLTILKNQNGEFVYFNGDITQNYRAYFSGSIFPIIQGLNIIAFTSGGSYNSSALLTATFTNQYLTI